MERWLLFAKGPLFIATFTLMMLGLARLVVLRIYLKTKLWLDTEKEELPLREMLISYFRFVFPPRKAVRVRPVLGATSLLFHFGLLVTPVFLVEHILLWKSGVGLSWPGLGRDIADFLTVLTILTCLTLIGIRIFHGPSRIRSRFSDYLLLVALLAPFVTGYVSMHPEYLFTGMKTMLLVHILSGELVFVLIPFTSFSHVVMIMFERAFSDFYLTAREGAAVHDSRARGGEKARA